MDVVPVLKIPGLSGGLTSAFSPAEGAAAPGTELPARQVVVAVDETASAASRQARAPVSLADITERQVQIDPETREIVRQSVDTRSGEVVAQYPDRAILGLRAYLERLSGKKAGRTSERQQNPLDSDRT